MSACLHRAILLAIAMFALSGCSDKDEPPKATTASPASTVASAPESAAAPNAPTAPNAAVFSTEQLDQMLAPLALYPDALLAQVLMATTYPGNVADAVVWSKAHPKVSGDAAVQQVADQPWDPSVQSLVAFPQVLATLGQDPVWVQRVGDAFLAQPDAVMNSVQRLRAKAKAAGHLESNEQQTVTVQPASASAGGTTTAVQGSAPAQTIVIQPTNPQIVYVPSYNPSVVYGNWSSPSYPPAYYPPPPEYPIATALATGLAFGAGIAIVNSLWGDCDWDDHDVDINVNRYNNINNVNRRLDANQNNWRHNPAYRDGVPYRDQASRAQFDRRLPGSEQRTAYRGDTPARVEDRARARESLAQHGIEAPATSNLEARQRVQSADRERAQQTLEKQGISQTGSARERAQVADRQLKSDAHTRQRAQAPQQNRQHQQPVRNQQVRQQVRQQHASAQAPRNNALAGVRNPSQSRIASNRGQVSQRSASRPSVASAGHQVQRPVRMHSSGGGRRR
ncbi:DUF3300 domain-containing protein [Pseudomonas sp. P66]|jgi:hypothetical protein|uniref:DUF3300 domain-containing protein n=1 Tax=Pseudomonas arcuscaelestis TaxID=2710591 RepID=A0ABS2BRQ1_9PSED|nr:DUF3300 domain-containing protein [Pseudomonas arcuscaelestis]MBM3104728.1 DUF3300 domain-containing protein [Pseudomonas arcuscaelestis]MBM3109948.1 DUF3300 domain-containing protein [Pseudomonas arcuscaelestis]MBM5456288.1 DUF3300 domain-containing protein [Pseudomonas arcuscaelestis]